MTPQDAASPAKLRQTVAPEAIGPPANSAPSASSRGPLVAAGAVLALLVCAVFFPVAGFEFIDLDEFEQVVDNPYVHGLTGGNVWHILTSRCTKSYYPVRTLTFAVDCQLWGLDGGSFKRTNVLVHLANVLLVYGLILRLLGHAAAPPGSSRAGWDTWIAAFSAGLFAVHPLVVEPVAWIVGREELLMTLGAVGCIHLHLSGRRLEENGRGRAAAACYAAAAACCAAACLSNAVGAVIPLLVTAWEVLTPSRSGKWKIVYRTGGLWAIGVATAILKKLGPVGDMRYVPEMFSPQWAVLILIVYWLNLKSLVWPTQLGLFYGCPAAESYLDPEILVGGLLIGLTPLVLWLLRRRRLALFGVLWFLIALAPIAQVLPHHLPRGDRFLYLPLVGLALAVAMGLRPLAESLKRRSAMSGAILAGACGLVLLAALSGAQVRTWRDGISVWRNSLRVDPDNALAHAALADNLSRHGRFDEAIPHYHTALRLNPESKETLNNFALRLAADDRPDLHDYDLAIRLAGRGCELTEWKDAKLRHTLAMAHAARASLLRRQGDFIKATGDYRRAIEADPDYDAPWFNLALLLVTCPEEKLRNPAAAVELAERGCRVAGAPDCNRLAILAQAYAAAGRSDLAAATTQKALQMAQAAGQTEPAAELPGQVPGERPANPPPGPR